MRIFGKFFEFKRQLIVTDENVQQVLDSYENEIVQLEESNLNLMRNVRKLESQIKFYQERLKIVETIKIDQKSKVNLWKIIAIISILFGILSWMVSFKNFTF
jgi:phage shock protein A